MPTPCAKRRAAHTVHQREVQHVRVRDVIGCLALIFIGRDGQHIAELIRYGKRILLFLSGPDLDLDIVTALSLVMAVIPDADVTRIVGIIRHRHIQSSLCGFPVSVIDLFCSSSLEVLGRAEDDVQILECSAVTPVIPEIDLADGIFVAKVDLCIGRVVRVLCFVLADLDIFCVIFNAICQPAVWTVTSTTPFIYNYITARCDII